MDWLSLGPVPAEEDCEQLGRNYDPVRARGECRRFIDLLRRALGPEPEGARYRITSNAHDFGNYYDVVIEFDCDAPGAAEYALKAERDAPSRWKE